MLKNNKKIGYTRVSTQEQEYENQIIQIKQVDDSIKDFVNEKISSGKPLEERKLFNLLNTCEKNTEIYITNLDRLARNTNEILKIIDICIKNDITIHITKIGIKIGIKMNPMDKMFITIMGSFAEMEKQIIIDRINDGLQRTNKKSGRRKGQIIKSKLEPYKKEILEYHKKDLSNNSIKKLLNDRIETSEMTIYRFIKKELEK